MNTTNVVKNIIFYSAVCTVGVVFSMATDNSRWKCLIAVAGFSLCFYIGWLKAICDKKGYDETTK